MGWSDIGELVKVLGAVATACAAWFAAYTAYRGLQRWRDETLGKRKTELASFKSGNLAGRGAFCRPEPHIVSMEPKFGDWEGIPVRWLPGEAWGFIKGEWVWVHPAEVGMNGAELDEESFLATFGRLMALPAIAFQARPDRWTASR